MMRPKLPRLNGRRGAFQVVFGVVYLIIGAGAILVPSPTRAAMFGWLTKHVGLEWFAALWIVAGLTALVCAFLPRPRDAAGFIAMVFAPGIWLSLFTIAGCVSGNPLAFVQAVVYGLLGAAPLIVSGMQGPRDRDARPVVR